MQRRDDWDETDVIAADKKLGYQIPRLWFAHDHPGGVGGGRPEQWAAAHEGAVLALSVVCCSVMKYSYIRYTYENIRLLKWLDFPIRYPHYLLLLVVTAKVSPCRNLGLGLRGAPIGPSEVTLWCRSTNRCKPSGHTGGGRGRERERRRPGHAQRPFLGDELCALFYV